MVALIASTYFWLQTSRCVACSGPGALASIALNERLGWILFAASMGAAAVSSYYAIRRQRRVGPGALAVMLAFVHPGWWLSARHGDCGLMLVEGSIAVTIVQAIVVANFLRRKGRAAKSPKPSDEAGPA